MEDSIDTNQKRSPSRSRMTGAEKQRLFEFVIMIVATFLLIGISRLETRLFDLSKSLSASQDFFTTVIYFGIINLNVILILVLGWLIFRNITKLVLDRRRGVIGSSLRVKLILSLGFFALAPTGLMFFISSTYITQSFDTWFSSRVRETMQQTQRAGAKVYEQDQRRLKSLARIALQRVDEVPSANVFPGQLPTLDAKRLEGFISEYNLDAARVYDTNGKLVWSSVENDQIGSYLSAPQALIAQEDEASEASPTEESSVNDGDSFVISAIDRFYDSPGLISRGKVESHQSMDVVKGMAPVYSRDGDRLIGVVVVEEHFETQILKSIQSILIEFADLRQGAQSMRLSFIVFLVLMLLLIVSAATWLGFKVSSRITDPIKSLAEGTREVALGNYDITIPARNDDETGQLVRSFNQMTSDLQKHKSAAERSSQTLREANMELDQRRKYMEVVLKSINAGVVSIDATNRIASINDAAESLFGFEDSIIGQSIDQAFRSHPFIEKWRDIASALKEKHYYSGQFEMKRQDAEFVLLIEAVSIFDENETELGVVLVVDDATEKVKVQKVAAWREVARRIAHEIKNPITPILLNAQRLQRRYGEKFEGEDARVFNACIDSILSQVSALKNMVNEFGQFSRLPAIHTSKGHVQAVLKEAVTLFEMSYPNISFATSEIATDLPEVHIDKEQINRVFMNIVSNAIAAVEKVSEPKIEISARPIESAKVIRIEISDNGSGIDPKFRKQVLEPYFSTKEEGTGLGLSIVQQIVSEHGGYLRIMDNDKQGTIVVVELPFASHESTVKPVDGLREGTQV